MSDSSKPDWESAARDCLSARWQLLVHEAKDPFGQLVMRVAFATVGGLSALVAWITTVIAAIGWAADRTGWSWYGVTFIAAALHLFIAFVSIAMLIRKTPSGSFFPLSRLEIIKDHIWLRNLESSRAHKR